MTFTKEQAELHAFITGFLSDTKHDDKSADSMTAKVFRMALAALTAPEQEQVAWRYRYVHTPKSEEHGSYFTTDWVITHSEDECNPSDCFERQPLYASPPALVVPDGYALVPVEPTEGMVIAGFEAELREEFRDPDAWEAYEAMSGCEQAALRAKWCWAAMVKTAPQQEVK